MWRGIRESFSIEYANKGERIYFYEFYTSVSIKVSIQPDSVRPYISCLLSFVQGEPIWVRTKWINSSHPCGLKETID